MLKDEKMARINTGDFSRGKAERERGDLIIHSGMTGEPPKVEEVQFGYPSQHLAAHLKLCQAQGNILCFKNC